MAMDVGVLHGPGLEWADEGRCHWTTLIKKEPFTKVVFQETIESSEITVISWRRWLRHAKGILTITLRSQLPISVSRGRKHAWCLIAKSASLAPIPCARLA